MKLLAGSLVLAGLIFAPGNALAQGNANDMQFAREAAIGGMTEVQMGQLAVQKGINDQVKALGQRLVDDHSRLNDQLRELAAKDSFTLPMDLDVSHKAEVQRFANMASGPAFDRDFLRREVADHEAAIAQFRSEAENGNNQDLKNFAASSLPTLQDHLAKAQAAQTAIGMTSRR